MTTTSFNALLATATLLGALQAHAHTPVQVAATEGTTTRNSLVTNTNVR